MTRIQLNFWLGMISLALVLSLGACSSDKNGDAASKDEKATTSTPDKDEKAEKPADNKPAGDEIAEDIYPGFNFGVLEPEERERFVKVAKAELCPCNGSAESLHVCLQNPAKRCELAQQLAPMIAMSIKSGSSQTDILDEILKTVEAAKKSYEFDLSDTPMKGSKDAKLVIVEFADFQCPHCREMSNILNKLSKKYGDKIAIYYKHFPLGGHPLGSIAAQAAVAAQRQGKFWPMHDLLFEYQVSLTPEKLTRFGQQIGLNMQKFSVDLSGAETATKVQADKKEGEVANITGTPSLFFNGVRFMGDRDEAGLTKAIDRALAATGDTPKK